MKKIIYLLIVAAMLVGCSHDAFDNTSYVTNSYNTAFVKTFGQPAENQTWGFSETPATTRGVDPNSNEWASKGYKVPGVITQDEINKVKAVFDVAGKASYESLVDWDCFFVQHVYGNHSNMDYLCSYLPNGKTETIYPDWNQWQPTEVTTYDDHIFNFNATSGSIQLMVESSTQRFGFHSSQDSQMHYWFRMEIDGAYYVGIDYEATGQWDNQKEARNFIYNDWVIKISPGKGSTPPVNNVRIMVEDLSASSGTDFDFNDAVFDVNIVNGNAECVLQAAGGILPLKIEGYEVHQLFGEPEAEKYPMINTGAGPTHAPVPFTINGKTNPKDIHIYVNKDGNWIEISANRGEPASKIATWQDKAWCTERQPIAEKYPGFPLWVNNPDIVW